MPHITYEAAPKLADGVDWRALMRATHSVAASAGPAELDDCKSRLIRTDQHLAGGDPAGEFVVARLLMTRPRPPEAQRSLAALVHERLRAAVAGAAGGSWWQACVVAETAPAEAYLRSDSHVEGRSS